MDMQVDKFKFSSFAKAKEGFVAGGNFKSGIPQSVIKVSEPVAAAPSAPASNNIAAERPLIQEPRVNIPAYSEKDITESRTKGYEEGYSKGFKDARTAADEINKQIEQNLKNIENQFAQMASAKNAAYLRQEKQVAEVIMAIAGKVVGSALDKNPLAEIENIVSKSFSMLFDEPELVITVNSTIADMLEPRVISIAAKEGFKGGVIIRRQDDVAAGGCVIEWKGGGLKADREQIMAEISRLCNEIF